MRRAAGHTGDVSVDDPDAARGGRRVLRTAAAGRLSRLGSLRRRTFDYLNEAIRHGLYLRDSVGSALKLLTAPPGLRHGNPS